ncbi:putative Hemerythrin-like protein [Rhodospirillaceae bacterium LM-1]|nr:putative Hemerythrin-like protein [Rhodospirillaceae bacterium LM-1]
MSEQTKQFGWRDEYSVGHLGLDGEHRYFIELINRLSLALASSFPRQEILDILIMLESETDIHFQHEEEVLKLTGYPSVRDHAEKHRKLLSDIIDVRHAVEKRTEIDIKAESHRISALRSQMFEHILREDMALRHPPR